MTTIHEQIEEARTNMGLLPRWARQMLPTQDAKEAEELFEVMLETAYWKFDALKKRRGMPMSERDAFKAAVRALNNGAFGK